MKYKSDVVKYYNKLVNLGLPGVTHDNSSFTNKDTGVTHTYISYILNMGRIEYKFLYTNITTTELYGKSKSTLLICSDLDTSRGSSVRDYSRDTDSSSRKYFCSTDFYEKLKEIKSNLITQ